MDVLGETMIANNVCLSRAPKAEVPKQNKQTNPMVVQCALSLLLVPTAKKKLERHGIIDVGLCVSGAEHARRALGDSAWIATQCGIWVAAWLRGVVGLWRPSPERHQDVVARQRAAGE